MGNNFNAAQAKGNLKEYLHARECLTARMNHGARNSFNNSGAARSGGPQVRNTAPALK